jgi:PilZ domain
MGKRCEPRKPVQVPVRIFGTDNQRRIFSENVTTVDISRTGAKLGGVRARLNIGEIVGLTCGGNKVNFRVKWVGQPGTPSEGEIGLLNLAPERPFWDVPLPDGLMDNYRAESRGDRRQSPRIKCTVSVELRPEGEPTMWGKASDLGVGGCFVEMAMPLKLEARFEICLWLSQTKLRLQGAVASSSPGFGIGVRFLNVSSRDREFLSNYIQAALARTK